MVGFCRSGGGGELDSLVVGVRSRRRPPFGRPSPTDSPAAHMEPLSPQLMHKLVFTVLMHGLNDSQTGLALKVLTDALGHSNPQVRELAVVALADLPVPAAKRVPPLTIALSDAAARV